MSRNTSRRPYKARLGLKGYAEILAIIKQSPSTIPDVAKAIGIGNDSAYHIVPAMHVGGLLHVGSWNMEPGRQTLPQYHYGPGEDVPAPTHRPNGREVRRVRVLRPQRLRPEILSFASLIRELDAGGTMPELREATGIHRDTIREVVKVLRQRGLARVAAWLPRDGCGGAYMAVFQLGQGQDAQRPARAKIVRRNAKNYRERVKAAAPFVALGSVIAACANEERAAA